MKPLFSPPRRQGRQENKVSLFAVNPIGKNLNKNPFQLGVLCVLAVNNL
jgi:hypothetical protein